MTRLALGTVEFGIDYGVGSNRAKPDEAEVARILAFAHANGVDTLDTAPLYGDSEAVLGRSLRSAADFSIVTKTGKFDRRPIADEDADELESSLRRSLDSLRTDRVYGLLCHRVGDLLAPGGELLWQRMRHLQQTGVVTKIGVSLYEPPELDAVLERFPIDIVQLPMNAFDNRFEIYGQLTACAAAGIEVHARSIFLQGVLLNEPEQLPPNLSGLRPVLHRLRQFGAEHALSPVELALACVRVRENVDAIVVGVHCRQELEEIVGAFARPLPCDFDPDILACPDEPLISPRNWPAAA
jgi:aryl-alcohol dehydrogenase-like predicted oxidoreductase